jgi:hypothetical protein
MRCCGITQIACQVDVADDSRVDFSACKLEKFDLSGNALRQNKNEVLSRMQEQLKELTENSDSVVPQLTRMRSQLR